MNGDEECDGTALGDGDCTSAGDFTGGELACAEDCTFDTSACIAADDCGNGVIDANEDCDGTELGGMTCSDVDSGGGALACADDCTFDTSGCQGDKTPSQLIQDARDAADGDGLSLPIAGALVTYVKPVLGNDVAGFFIQAEQAGPALFVAIDATTLDPVPAVGDTVSFTITGKTTQDGQPRATAIADLAVGASGADVAALVQDIGAASDLLAPVGGYDSELVAMDATIIADFGFAGTGAEAADIATEGLPAAGEIHPRFRLDPALRDSLDLASGCAVRIGPTPLWRFQDTAQPSIWAAGEVAITSCNAPRVVSATAPDATTVVVTFDRFIDPLTVDVGSFDFDPDLTVTDVAVDGREITVTTEVQSPQTPYTVTVSGVTDTRSSPIDGTAASQSFTGF
ncbi:MAG TPA: Ig-like domain-containing protein, partial [Kofleriaceae bacterium]|nr:Ig-like domain-containing protein [Kofleriaceae bacterium]